MLYQLSRMSIPSINSGTREMNTRWGVDPLNSLWDGFRVRSSHTSAGGLWWHFGSCGIGFSLDLVSIALQRSKSFLFLRRNSHRSFWWQMKGKITTVYACCDVARSFLKDTQAPLQWLALGLTTGSGLETGQRIMAFHCNSWHQSLAHLLFIFSYTVQATCCNLTTRNTMVS